MSTAELPFHVVLLFSLMFSSVVCFHAAHYEKLIFQLSKQVWNYMTGLLLIYPSCVLHVIEVSFTTNKYSQRPFVMEVRDL